MPITNVFNEWYAANTSRKVRAIFTANAKMGKSNMWHHLTAFGPRRGQTLFRIFRHLRKRREASTLYPLCTLSIASFGFR